jgi:hypothetical protein
MAAGVTYSNISTTTLGTASATVSFSSIPSTYTDLILVCSILGADATRLWSFNGDTASNYSYTFVRGDGSTATSGRGTTEKMFIAFCDITNTTQPTVAIANFQNYSNTSTYKTVVMRGSAVGKWVSASIGMWRSTAAINSFTISTDAGSFGVGSTFTLYGVTNA